ncbi:MAG TPA: sigma 54-interacting transcriptional regulator [Haliangium sp.]|nr:sigma 54-interacting transcriptional regulator [Haliangium sp.]
MTQDVQQQTTQLTATNAATRVEASSSRRVPIPALTIIHHPTLRRIGDRALLGELVTGREAKISRHSPRFAPPHQPQGAPLGDDRISRSPFELRLLGDGSVSLEPGESRTKIVIDDRRVTAPQRFSPAELARGVMLELGDRVALLLHVYLPCDESETGDLGLVGHSAEIARVRESIRRVADLDVPVLIRGETGTGKELVASAIHEAGARRSRPLVSVNLASLPAALAAAELFGATRGAFTGASRTQEGYFRRAHGGTLFLDEIGEAPVDVQVMLLRAIETGEIYALGAQRAEQVDVRLISATDANLDTMVEHGVFRAPLLHRLAGYEIHLPPLRARRDDVGRLLIHFLGLELAEIGETDRLDRSEPGPWLSMSLMTRLVRYDWPGNVRQLRNAVRQLVIGNRGRSEAELPESLARLLDGATQPDLSLHFHDTGPQAAPESAGPDGEPDERSTGPVSSLRRKPSEIPEAEIAEALRTHRWDIKATARELGISRTSLYGLIESSGLVRTAGELGVDEIRACHHAAGGDLDAMVERLCVSKKALRRRIRELGLA